MPKFVFPFLLPLGVFLAMFVLIGAISAMYFAGGHTGSVVVGLVLTILIGIACYLVDRRGGPRTAGH